MKYKSNNNVTHNIISENDYTDNGNNTGDYIQIKTT